MKLLKSALLASAFVGLAAVPVGAVDYNGTATVSIVEDIAITQDAALRFGNIQKPTDAATSFTVHEDGSPPSKTGGNGAFVGPEGLRGPGQYDVNGTNSASYTFSAVAGACSDAALSLGSITDSAGTTLDDLNVQVGGTLTVQTTVSPGNYTCGYTLSAIYS